MEDKPFCIDIIHSSFEVAHDNYIKPFVRNSTSLKLKLIRFCGNKAKGYQDAISYVNDPYCKLVIVDIPEAQLSKSEELAWYYGEVCCILALAIEKKKKVLVLKNIKGGIIGSPPTILRNQTIIGYQNVGTVGLDYLLSFWMNGQLELKEYLNKNAVPWASEYSGKYDVCEQNYKVILHTLQDDEDEILSTITTGGHEVLQLLKKCDLEVGERGAPLLSEQPQSNYRGEAYYTISEKVYEDFLLTGFAIHFAKESCTAKVWVKSSDKTQGKNVSNEFVLDMLKSNVFESNTNKKNNTKEHIGEHTPIAY